MNVLDTVVRSKKLGLILGVLAGAALLATLEGCSGPGQPPESGSRPERRAARKRRPVDQTPPAEPAGAQPSEPTPAPDGSAAPAEGAEPAAANDGAAAGDAKAKGDNDGAVAEAPPEEPAAPPAEEKAPPSKGAAGGARSGKMTPEEFIRVLGLSDDARKQESQDLVREAQARMTDLETARAEELLEKAVKLDPSNSEAKRKLAEVQTVLDSRLGKIHQMATSLAEEERVRKQEARAQVRMSLNSGERHREAKEFDEAIRDYQKAIEMIRRFPADLQLDAELARAQKELDAANVGRKEQQDEDRRALAQRVRETKEEELKTSVDLLENRIRELRRKGADAWEREEYARAEEIAQQILVARPEDEKARELLARAREERHLQTIQQVNVSYAENHQILLVGLEEATVSYQKIFRYPPGREWQRLQPRLVTLEEKVLASESPVEKEIRRKLDTVQTIGFQEKTPLGDALKVLTQISGINFTYTKDAGESIRNDGVQVTTPLLKDTPLKHILSLLLQSAGEKGFKYTIRDGAVLIGLKEDEAIKPQTYTEFYDVSDVTQARPDFPAPRSGLDEGIGGKGGAASQIQVGAATDEEAGKVNIEITELIKLISAELKDESGEAVGAEPKILNGKLMIKTSLHNHEKVRRLLAQLRKATGMMVTVESRFLDIQENFLEEIGIDMGNPSNTFLPNSIPDIDGAGTSIDPGYEYTNTAGDHNLRIATLGGFSQSLGSKVNPFNLSSSGGGAYQLNVFNAEKFQLEAVLTAVGKEQSIRKLNSPRVTAFNTQTAHTLVINQQAYIQDLEVNQTGVIPVINPVIGVLNSGSILEVRPTVSYDRKYVTLEIQPTLTEKLQSERAVLNLSGNFTSVPVELPVLSLTKIKTTVTIPDGGTVLVGGLRREIKTDQSIGVPVIRHIPILNILWGRKGESSLRSSLFVLINAKITVVQEEEERLFNT